jgi:hypothetical protein
MKIYIGPYPNKGKRKINIRIDNYDVWSLDHTLAYIIAPALKLLKKQQHGTPILVEMDENGKFDQKTNTKKWNEILNHMIWAFTELAENKWEEKYYSGRPDIIKWTEIKSGPYKNDYEMKKGPKDTFKVDHKGRKQHEAKIQKGLDLFGKYYRYLWD